MWDHRKKQLELALAAINRPPPYRPMKVVPHDPGRVPRMTTKIKGWITSEIFLLGKTPEQMENLLGFDSRAGSEYLVNGIDVFRFTRPINADDVQIGGAYTHLPDGKPWDGKDMRWPPGAGAPQWKLVKEVDCVFVKTVPRGTRFY